MIENTILELIETENEKMPLTDNDIAIKVNTTRAYITQFRKQKKFLVLTVDEKKFYIMILKKLLLIVI